MRVDLKSKVSKFIYKLPPNFYARGFKLFNLFLKYPVILKVVNDQILVLDKVTDFKIFNSRPRRIRRYSKGVQSRCDSLLLSYCLEELDIPNSAIIVDIGANVGEVSYSLIQKNNSAQIIAIEPDPQEFKDLVKNLSFSSSIALNTVVGNYTGDIDLFLNNDSGDSSVFFTAGAKNKISSTCTTLDDIYIKHIGGKSVFLVKCEAEGFEPEVLLCGKLTLSNTKYVSCDTGPERLGKSTYEDVNKILVEMNFQLIKSNKHRQLYMNMNNKLADR
jgi:FkbM family methyltransferase